MAGKSPYHEALTAFVKFLNEGNGPPLICPVQKSCGKKFNINSDGFVGNKANFKCKFCGAKVSEAPLLKSLERQGRPFVYRHAKPAAPPTQDPEELAEPASEEDEDDLPDHDTNDHALMGEDIERHVSAILATPPQNPQPTRTDEQRLARHRVDYDNFYDAVEEEVKEVLRDDPGLEVVFRRLLSRHRQLRLSVLNMQKDLAEQVPALEQRVVDLEAQLEESQKINADLLARVRRLEEIGGNEGAMDDIVTRVDVVEKTAAALQERLADLTPNHPIPTPNGVPVPPNDVPVSYSGAVKKNLPAPAEPLTRGQAILKRNVEIAAKQPRPKVNANPGPRRETTTDPAKHTIISFKLKEVLAFRSIRWTLSRLGVDTSIVVGMSYGKHRVLNLIVDKEFADELANFLKEELKWTAYDPVRTLKVEQDNENRTIFKKRTIESSIKQYFHSQRAIYPTNEEFIKTFCFGLANELTSVNPATLETIWAEVGRDIAVIVSARETAPTCDSNSDVNQQ